MVPVSPYQDYLSVVSLQNGAVLVDDEQACLR